MTTDPLQFVVPVETDETDWEHGLFVIVRVFVDRAALLVALRGDGWEIDDQVAGAFQNSRAIPLTRCLGRVSFCREKLGTEVITHEFAHAAFAYLHRLRLVEQLSEIEHEETYCYALGRMCSRFVRRATERGLYPD